ncbi:MAG: phenylalanine--tRNA ligase subunit beta [Patescibacteria group bacterium]
MKFSYNWLQEYISDPLPPVEELANALGMHSFELEGVEALENGDYLIDWDILPNRSSDCLCYEGVAREIAAVCELRFKPYLQDLQEASGVQRSDEMIDFSLDTDLVPRATKRYVEGITIGPSPDWLRERLESIGQKSINNVVDITNYVMFVTGQPVHAFDYDKLAGGGEARRMSIRHAQDGEVVHTLDGGEYTLDTSMLVVADAEKALDIAGIKGGNNSGVDESTTRIVLSACNYDYAVIRQTSRKLKLTTDASKRYENEVPLCKADRAMALLTHLLESECGARVSPDIIDTAPQISSEVAPITFTLDHTNNLLGLELTAEEVISLLARLEIHTTSPQDSVLRALALPERLDLRIAEDIIEEIGRLYGYTNIPELAIEEGFPIPEINILKQSWYSIGDTLVNLGFYEVYNRSLVASGRVALANALHSEAGNLRDNLHTALLDRVARNSIHSEEPKLFEIGKVFTGISDDGVDEHWSFAGIMGHQKIKDKHKQDIFLQTKGVLETAFHTIGVRNLSWEEAGEEEVIALLRCGDDEIGFVGVNYWEINFEKLIKYIDRSVSYVPPSRFPKIDRDVAVWVPLDIRVRDVRALIEGSGPEKCISTTLFDVYEDIDNNRKSIGFRLVFQCWDQTLSDEYANEQMQKVYKVLQAQEGFEIR